MSNTIEKEMIYHETKSENGINDQKQKAAHVQKSMKSMTQNTGRPMFRAT
jgi:hypothetical protein